MALGPLLAFGCLEGVLRLGGYGYPSGFFLLSQIRGQRVVIENEKFGWRFFGPVLARTPRPMVFPVVKSSKTYRIFVLGESAAYGDPKPEFGMPRFLEVLLRDRFPETDFEVINAAMTGINSHVLLPIARDCARHDGDLWVIYMGNNEVVGPFGSGTVFGPQSPGLALVRSTLALKATRTGELLTDLTVRARAGQASQPEWGMSLFLDQQVGYDDPRMPAVYSHFTRNLGDILKVARDHGVKIVLSTVASNLKDCAPFASRHRLGLTDIQSKECTQLYQAGLEAEKEGKLVQAVEQFERAGAIDDQVAELQFHWGRCYLALGRDEEARRRLVLARDYDTLRFRADSRINDAIRKVAAGREKDGVLLADGEAALAHKSSHGVPGEEVLYEHVHLNFDGNYQLACTLGDQVLKLLPSTITARKDARSSWLPPGECARRLAWTDWDRYKTLRSVMLRLNAPPFSSQFDQVEHCQRLQQEMEKLLPALRPEALRQAQKQYREALAFRPEDWVLHRGLGELLLKLGDLTGAEAAWRQVTLLLPHYDLGYLELGSLLLQAGRPEEAITQFELVLRLKPDSVPALNSLALALTRLGRQEEAMLHYEHALKLKPESLETRLNLGTALQNLGRNAEATAQFRLALLQSPNTPEALLRLGKVCAAQGWMDEAMTNFAKAVRLNPTDATAHFCLGGALEARRQRSEAQQQFAQAVRLDPDMSAARVCLGVELRYAGKELEALEQFSEAVRQAPNLLEARLNLGLALLHQQRTADAREQFEAALRIDPNNATAQKHLGARSTE